jgi:hypothetical protein
MKKYFTFRFTLMLVLSFLVASCTEEDHVIPDPVGPDGKEELQKDILGKWIVETRTGKTTAENAFLEFLSDSTYIVYGIADTLAVGEFKATSGNEISLVSFGSLSEIKFANDKISFKLAYAGKTVTITAGKSGVINPSDKTRLLTRSWSLTTEEDGSQLINEATGVDKVTVLFTPSQTYLVQFFSKGKLVEGGMNNWEWHGSDPNRFVYWEDGQAVKEGNYGTIHELTETRLKVTDNADGNPLTFIMVPVK